MDRTDINKLTDDDEVKQKFGESFLKVFAHPRVILAGDGRAFIELKKPVRTIEGETTNIVEIREPTVKELREVAKKDDVDGSAQIMANMIGCTDGEINKLPQSDFLLYNEVVNAFLKSGR